jgi:creatinine amidohydrolase/Fe(II)-dependent formamide hydrolase-like protein
MKRLSILVGGALLVLSISVMFAQVPVVEEATRKMAVKDIVDIELLTHSEIYDKIHKEGKSTVIIVNGGTEQRGPQNVLGGHTIMGHEKGIEIAKKLGNALVAPTLPYGTNASGLGEAMPGGVSLPSEVFKGVKTAEVESMVANGFKTIFLMGDHGGGQAEMAQVAQEEEKKLSPKGIHVYYIADFYYKAHDDFDLYCYNHKLPIQSHGGIMDTSQMMYMEPVQGIYTRAIYKTVPYNDGPDNETWKKQYDERIANGGARGGGQRGGDAAAAGGQRGRGGRGDQPQPAANRDGSSRGNNGITGNPHQASKDLGRISADIAVNNAIAEIQKVLAAQKSSTNQK